MTWYYAQAKTQDDEWITISKTYFYRYELSIFLDDFKKSHRGEYKRYRIKELEL